MKFLDSGSDGQKVDTTLLLLLAACILIRIQVQFEAQLHTKNEGLRAFSRPLRRS
jgi:hypothetical protein